MGVGKTSIARRLAFGEFGGEYKSTIGVEVLTYDIADGPGGIPFKFLIWDTDGGYGTAILETVYMQGAQAAFFVADVSRSSTIADLTELAELYDARLPGRYSAVVLNKIDLLATVKDIELPAGLLTKDRRAIRTSAKTGEGVVAAFQEAAETIVRRGLLS